MRIGHGYDVHGFTEGDHLVLGGVHIPFSYSFLAHSDGDVVIHALIDALLGALALGDIGQHFPDSDAQFKDCDSRALLRKISGLMVTRGYQPNNADITIIAEKPKMAPHLAQMRINLAQDLNCEVNDINIKATTTETLGYIGRSEGIACHAVVLLRQIAEA
jgi:2-C-methyl-D-erythritol 2,4-cyclodiphosphate synthase